MNTYPLTTLAYLRTGVSTWIWTLRSKGVKGRSASRAGQWTRGSLCCTRTACFVCALFHMLYFTVERLKNAYSMLPEGRYCVQLNHYISHILCANYLAQMVKNRLAMQEKGLDPWVRKIPWKKEWQPTPVFLPGKSHGQRGLVDYCPWGRKRIRHDSAQHTHIIWITLPKSITLVINYTPA